MEQYFIAFCFSILLSLLILENLSILDWALLRVKRLNKIRTYSVLVIVQGSERSVGEGKRIRDGRLG